MIVLKEEDKVNVLGIPLYAKNISEATFFVVHNCNRTNCSNQCISATGAHGLVFSKKNSGFNNVLSKFLINLPDGMPGVWIGRLKGAKQMRRCYGPDFFKSVLLNSKNLPIKHFFCGGNVGVAEELRDSVQRKFGNTNIVGTYCPPFLKVEDYNYNSIAYQINQSGANIVWVGLSTPKQELFAYLLSRHTEVNFIITVGAAFDFHTGKVRQAPVIMQQLGFEWFFRLLMEPRRLFRRYFEIIPAFIYFNFLDWINERFKRSS